MIFHASTHKIGQQYEKEWVKLKRTLVFLLLAILLTGCHRNSHTDVASQIVTEITVTCETCTEFTRRYYNTHEKMQPILLYLRAVSPGFKPDTDPEHLSDRIICITLQKADGSTKVYRQKADRYLQQDHGDWRKINPEWGVTLYRILLENDSDPQKRDFLNHGLPGSWQYSRWIRQVTGNAIALP